MSRNLFPIRAGLLLGFVFLADAASPASAVPAGDVVVLSADDEFGKIDNRASREILAQLRSAVDADRARALEQVLAQPSAYVPPVLFVVAEHLASGGRQEEAAYWFQLAHLRAMQDARILTDRTAASGVMTLAQAHGQAFFQYAASHLRAVSTQLTRAVEWDRAHPPTYDRRWLAPHGMVAIQSALAAREGRSVDNGPMTIPQAEWAAKDEETRRMVLESVKARVDAAAASGDPDRVPGLAR